MRVSCAENIGTGTDFFLDEYGVSGRRGRRLRRDGYEDGWLERGYGMGSLTGVLIARVI